MAIKTSESSIQGLGSLSADAIIISGSEPDQGYDVTLNLGVSDDSYWTSLPVTFSNITSLTGTSNITINPNAGYAISSSIYSSEQAIASNPTYFSNVVFTDNGTPGQPSNTVNVEITWVTTSLTQDLNLVISNFQTAQTHVGSEIYQAQITVNCNSSINTSVSTEFNVYNIESQLTSSTHTLQSLLQPNTNYLVAVVNIELAASANLAFYSDPYISIQAQANDDLSDNYSTTSVVTGSQIVVSIYYNSEQIGSNSQIDIDSNGIDSIQINCEAQQPQLYAVDSNGIQASTFTYPDNDPNNGLTTQHIQIPIVHVLANVGQYGSLNFTGQESGLQNLTYTPPAEGSTGTGYIEFDLPDNAADQPDRQCSIYLETYLGSGQAGTTVIFINQLHGQYVSLFDVSEPNGYSPGFIGTAGLSKTLTLDIDYSSSASGFLWSSIITNPDTALTQLQSNTFPYLQVEPYQNLQATPSTDWFNVVSLTIAGSKLYISYTISENAEPNSRGIMLTGLHPFASELSSSFIIVQDSGWNPAVDTITFKNPSSAQFSLYGMPPNNVIGSFPPPTPQNITTVVENVYNGFNYYSGNGIVVSNQDDSITLLLKVAGAPLIETPTVYTLSPDGDLTSLSTIAVYPGPSAALVEFGTNTTATYEYYINLQLPDNNSTQDFDQILHVAHPNASSSISAADTVTDSIIIRKSATNSVSFNPNYAGTYDNSSIGDLNLYYANSDGSALSLTRPMYSTNGLTPKLRLETVIQYEVSQNGGDYNSTILYQAGLGEDNIDDLTETQGIYGFKNLHVDTDPLPNTNTGIVHFGFDIEPNTLSGAPEQGQTKYIEYRIGCYPSTSSFQFETTSTVNAELPSDVFTIEHHANAYFGAPQVKLKGVNVVLEDPDNYITQAPATNLQIDYSYLIQSNFSNVANIFSTDTSAEGNISSVSEYIFAYSQVQYDTSGDGNAGYVGNENNTLNLAGIILSNNLVSGNVASGNNVQGNPFVLKLGFDVPGVDLSQMTIKYHKYGVLGTSTEFGSNDANEYSAENYLTGPTSTGHGAESGGVVYNRMLKARLTDDSVSLGNDYKNTLEVHFSEFVDTPSTFAGGLGNSVPDLNPYGYYYEFEIITPIASITANVWYAGSFAGVWYNPAN